MTNPPPTISDSERDRLLAIKMKCRHFLDTDKTGNLRVTKGTRGLAGKASTEVLSILDKKIYRTEFYTWLFEREITSSTELTKRELFGFVGWAFENQDVHPEDESLKWTLPARFYEDMRVVVKAFTGQYEFDLPLRSNGGGKEQEILRQLGFENHGGESINPTLEVRQAAFDFYDEVFVSLECPHGFENECPHGCHL